jgi:hypothetical protein
LYALLKLGLAKRLLPLEIAVAQLFLDACPRRHELFHLLVDHTLQKWPHNYASLAPVYLKSWMLGSLSSISRMMSF